MQKKILDDEVIEIIRQYAREYQDKKMRAQWVHIPYDGIGMQDRLHPLWNVAKICGMAVVPLVMIVYC